ncbi:MAG: metallopeptidase TldD-related protein, partial [Actinomycetes bacterium]
DLVEHALAAATGPTVAFVTEHREANLRWAANSLTTNGEMRGRTLTVVATVPAEGGTAAGTVSRAVATLAEAADAVAVATAAARSAPAAEDAYPLVEDYGHGDDWGAPAEDASIDVLSGFATDLGGVFGDAADRDHLLFGFAELVAETTYLGSTTGLRRRAVSPAGRLELNAKTADLAGSAWHGVGTRDFSDVDVAAAYETLSTRLGWGARPLELPAGRYETLLPPSAVADLMIYTYWSAAARDAEEGRTVFSRPGGGTRLGQRLSELPVRLWSDPTYSGLECPPFVIAASSGGGLQSVFDNGLPLAATDWLADGELRNLVRSRAWADRTGQPVRPPVDNLILDAAGGAGLEEMVARTERGLLLTCLWYIREVDPERLLLTGLTRDGVYLVEDGEVRGAVNNFRWNESPVELLGRLSEVGRSEPVLPREWNDWFTRTVMPPIRVPDFHMSTVSPAS